MNDQNQKDQIDFPGLGEKAVEKALDSKGVRTEMRERMKRVLQPFLQSKREVFETLAITASDEELVAEMQDVCERHIDDIQNQNVKFLNPQK